MPLFPTPLTVVLSSNSMPDVCVCLSEFTHDDVHISRLSVHMKKKKEKMFLQSVD